MSQEDDFHVNSLITRRLRVREIEEFLALIDLCGLTFEATDTVEAYKEAMDFGSDIFIVAEHKNKIVGGIVIKYSPLWTIVSHLCVHPEYRRNGAGYLLVNQALSTISNLGGTRATVSYIAKGNQNSIALSKKLSEKLHIKQWPEPLYLFYADA